MNPTKIIMCGVVALAAAACTNTSNHATAVARVEATDAHVLVRAEAGRIWWAHRAWTEPHELWSLPTEGRVDNLTVSHERDGFVVTFEQGGTLWSGTFGRDPATSHATELARREP